MEIAQIIDDALYQYYVVEQGKEVPNWRYIKDQDWWIEYLKSLGIDPRNPQCYNYCREDLRRSDQKCQASPIQGRPEVWNKPLLDVQGGPLSYSGAYCQSVGCDALAVDELRTF